MKDICSYQSDMYSYGMVLYELCAGAPPFGAIKDEKSLKTMIIEGMSVTVTEDMRSQSSMEVAVFEYCIKTHPHERPPDMATVISMLRS